jgi:hypothetical protein
MEVKEIEEFPARRWLAEEAVGKTGRAGKIKKGK